MQNKKRILWWGDFIVPTGFGNVNYEIIRRLLKTGKYQIDVIAVNYAGDPYKDHPDYGEFWSNPDIKVYPAAQVGDKDPLGCERVIERLQNGNYDIFFSLQDTFQAARIGKWVEELSEKKGIKWVYYFPVDSDHLKVSWVAGSIARAHVPVAYNEHGRGVVMKSKVKFPQEVRVIPHGVDLERFKPLLEYRSEEFYVRRKAMLGLDKDAFLFTNVNRNQPRKDLLATLHVFAQACAENIEKDLYLYLHCNPNDPAGFDILEVIQNHPLYREFADKIIIAESGYTPHDVMPVIYNLSDVVISTTLGEGAGLSYLEAMACGVPVIAPNHTSAPEIFGKDGERGAMLVSVSDPIILPMDNGVVRNRVHFEDFIWEMCEFVRNEGHPGAMRDFAQSGREWLENNGNWDLIVKQWDELFQRL